MAQVCAGLVERGDAVADRGRAAAQAAQLRKDEPHPVTAFSSGAQLLDDVAVDRSLRVDETLQVEGVACTIPYDYGCTLDHGSQTTSAQSARPGAADPVQTTSARRDQAPPRRRVDHRRSAAHRQAAHPQGGVRLHRRRGRGRAVHRARATSVPRHRVSPDDPAGRQQCDRRMGCPGPAGRPAVRDRADRIHPVDAHRGRDRRRARGGHGGDPVLAVHPGYHRDRRRGDRCSAGPQVVSVVHVA